MFSTAWALISVVSYPGIYSFIGVKNIIEAVIETNKRITAIDAESTFSFDNLKANLSS